MAKRKSDEPIYEDVVAPESTCGAITLDLLGFGFLLATVAIWLEIL